MALARESAPTIWAKVIERIISPSIQFKVEQVDSELRVIVKKEHAKKAAEELSLASEEQVLTRMPYTMQPSTAPARTPYARVGTPVEKVAAFPEDLKAQVTILENLIGAELKGTGINLSDLFSQTIGGSLVSLPTQRPNRLRAYDNDKSIFIEALGRLSPEQVRHAFNGTRITSAQAEAMLMTEELAKEYVGVGTLPGDAPGEQRLMVKLRKLHAMLTPVPVDAKVNADTQEVVLSVSVNSFLLKLKQAFRQHSGMMLSKEGEAIFFGIRNFDKPHEILLMLDHSRSMANHLAKLQEQACHFFTTLKSRNVNFPVAVEVTYFSANAESKRFENICGDEKQFANLIHYISGKQVSPGTRLNMTVIEKLQHILSRGETKDKHVTLLLFTDGEDSCNPEKAIEIPRLINEFKAKELPLPLGFALALGTWLDMSTLKMISSLSGTEPMMLEKITDFAPRILAHLERIQSEATEKSFRLLQDNVEQLEKFLLLHNDTLQPVPGVRIRPGARIQVDGGPLMQVANASAPAETLANNMFSSQSSRSSAAAAAATAVSAPATFNLPQMRFTFGQGGGR